LQPNANTGPRKRSLRHALDSQVDYSLDRQDEIGDVAYSVRDLGRSGNFRLAFLDQPPHVHLSFGRLWSSAEMLVSGATPGLAPRTVSNVFTYDMTSSALSVSRLSYVAFHSLSDTERTGVGCSVDSVGGGLSADSTGRAGGSVCDAAGGW
jgi:hypothetical protein